MAAGFILLLLPAGGHVAFASTGVQSAREWRGRDGENCAAVERRHEYEFSDYQGQAHKGFGLDYTEKLYEGMSVPVFYDRDNPKRQIAYCSTMHES
jgi:hypothetical protein